MAAGLGGRGRGDRKRARTDRPFGGAQSISTVSNVVPISTGVTNAAADERSGVATSVAPAVPPALSPERMQRAAILRRYAEEIRERTAALRRQSLELRQRAAEALATMNRNRDVSTWLLMDPPRDAAGPAPPTNERDGVGR